MRLLVVGKLNGQLSVAVKMAMNAGAKVSHVETTEAATNALRAGQGADLLMVDYALDIASFIASNEAERMRVPVVACGVDADPMRAAAAIKAGAKEFIPLPPDAELIAAVLAAVTDDEKPMVVRDPAMESVIKLADQVAPSDASILITGESGSGKEVMARYVHSKSRRAKAPFISVNCAAIPENLLESELFGHEKGAFTGAMARRIGKFEEADGGTLLLDEISEMDVRLQAKLLRAIQEREIDRVGGSKPVKVNIRILATSNRDLAQSVKDGVFREDLLYRLNVVNLRLPPLRERPGDVISLCEFFVKKYSAANGVAEKPISAEARRRLIAHRWPGNVRELQNVLRSATLFAEGPVLAPADFAAFGETFGDPSEEAPADGVLEGLASWEDALYSCVRDGENSLLEMKKVIERECIARALSETEGNITRAASLLGMKRPRLSQLVKQYGLGSQKRARS